MIEDKIQSAIKPIISIYSQIELEIIEKIAEHFNINDEFINSDYWYLEKLKELGGLNNETIKLLEKYTGKTKQELLKAMKDIGINAIPTEQLNIATQKGALLNPESIINSINIQNIINYSYDEIEKSFLQLNKTIEEKTREIYKDIATQTYIKTSSGMYSYQEAILESLDELGNKGISILEYQTDKGIRRYDVVGTVRRDLLCATRGLAGKVNKEVIKESGNHIVRVSHHFGARTGDGGENYTNHAWWQEKQFFCWNYDGKATEEEKKLPDFMKHCKYGDVQGIVGINCKHFFTTWYGPLEKDKLDFTYEENEEQYRKTQDQRYLENGVRKWKRKQVIANKAQDEEGYEKASKKAREWQDRLKTFTEENDLKRDYTREHIKDHKAVTIKEKDDIITLENLPNKIGINLQEYDYFDNTVQEDVSKLLGMDKKPKIINSEQFEKTSGTEIVRSVHSYHSKTAEEAYQNTLNGPIQYSESTNSSFGRGLYFADKISEKQIISFYSGKDGDYKIINAKISEKAKILEFNNQLEYLIDVNKRISRVPNNLKSFYEKETSLLYMLDGIDGIKLRYNHYYCIYNRGVLIVNEQ